MKTSAKPQETTECPINPRPQLRRSRQLCALFLLGLALGFLVLRAGDASVANLVAGSNGAVTVTPGTDINLITGPETYPKVTQNESWSWGHGNTVVVTYNDSSGMPSSGCGISVSTDGGATFTRLAEKFNATARCSGLGSVFYSVRAAKWYATFLSDRCGSGVGQWVSTDGVNWSVGACSVTTGSPDRPSTWVDNNSASPYFGRQYVTYSAFSASQALRIAYSTDDGATWSLPISLTTSYRAPVKITGSLGTDGTVFVQGMDEGGGGLSGPRTNFIHRSTNGGASWSAIQQGPSFLGPGRGTNGYFATIYSNPPYWRNMGWGQPGVGPNGVVHYVYAARTGGSSTDPGDIYYIRSADNGSTWSTPLKLNTDTTTRCQWAPSLSVNAQGYLFVSWYDERNTTDDRIQRFGRASLDNGSTWEAELVVSDVVFPKPAQPDPSFTSTYVGLTEHASFSDSGFGNTAYHGWTDGRVAINNVAQQDIFFDRIVFAPAPTPTPTPAPTPTPTPTPTATPVTTLANISTRLRVETGDNVLIGGFIVTGTQPKKVIVRGIGTSLPFSDKLENPTLELHGSNGLIEANDNWVDSPNYQAIIDSTIPPSNNLESAIVAMLPANNAGYTAIVRGANSGTGIGVVEAYDLDTAADSKLANISTRGLVQTGDNVLIAGTIVVGQVPQRVIIRAIGPSLPIAGKMENPTLELRDSSGTLLQENDNWGESADKQAIIDTTIPPSHEHESAIIALLPANNASYTAIVRGVNDTTGIAVVEVYALD